MVVFVTEHSTGGCLFISDHLGCLLLLSSLQWWSSSSSLCSVCGWGEGCWSTGGALTWLLKSTWGKAHRKRYLLQVVPSLCIGKQRNSLHFHFPQALSADSQVLTDSGSGSQKAFFFFFSQKFFKSDRNHAELTLCLPSGCGHWLSSTSAAQGDGGWAAQCQLGCTCAKRGGSHTSWATKGMCFTISTLNCC